MNPNKFVAKRHTALEAKILQKPQAGAVIASIVPKGPRLNLEPVLDRILVSSPDAGAEEQDILNGIHLPPGSAAQFHAYAAVEVIAIGPEVRGVKVGDRVIVPRGACQQFTHEGQSYFWINVAGIMGIIR